jgi:hypothetical protein
MFFDGVRQSPRLYGSTASPAQFQDNDYSEDTATYTATATYTDTDSTGRQEAKDDSASRNANDANAYLIQNSGYYQKIKRLLLGKEKDSAGGGGGATAAVGQSNDEIDPFYRGIQPFFTATLVNQSPYSYWHGSGSESSEDLRLSIYLHDDGVARMRITEQYPANAFKSDQPYATPRWTSDELILNNGQFKAFPMEHVHVLDKVELDNLLGGGDFENLDNYIAMRYGNLAHVSSTIEETNMRRKENDLSVLLLVQFYPFAVHMWRYNMDTQSVQTDSPIVSFNSDQLMHFEVRRTKEDGEVGIRRQTESLNTVSIIVTRR